MVNSPPAADPSLVRRTALACVMVAVLRAQSPQGSAAAVQRESILRQQQAISAQAAARGVGFIATSGAAGDPGSAPPQTSITAQIASIQRQQAALARQTASARPGQEAPGTPLIPQSQPEPPANPAESEQQDGPLSASLARQRESAALQPRLSWPDPPEPASLLACAPLPLATLAPIFDRAASTYGLESSLLRAVARKESAFQPCAISRSGAMGLMQLMPETAATLGVTDPFDAEQSIFGGARFLRFLLDRFQNDLTLALSAYNAGPSRVEQYGGIPPIPETQDYVSSILRSLGKPAPD
jgi:soluble lytic murein transglycosylase-like protein